MNLRFVSGVEIDTTTVEIRVDGVEVPVEPQVFDVITYLVEHRERVVPKEELLDNVWGDRFVSASALTTRVKSARQAVGDDGRSQRFIKTVHGRGYRWIAPLAETGSVTGVEVDTDPSQMPSGPAAEADDEWPLVGRQGDLETIARAYRDPSLGGVLLTGPAGMGKSRLARVALATAAGDGIATETIGGHAQLQSVPLGCIAQLLPDDVTVASGLDGELSRTMLFQRAVTAIEARAGRQRLMFHVDDIDLTDELTKGVLTALATGSRVFLLLTQRADARGPVVFDNLVRNGRIVRHEVGPIDAGSLGVAVYTALRRPLAPGSLDRLTAAAEGNPGVCRHLVEQSIDQGTLRVEAGSWTLTGELVPPPDLMAAFEARLDDLDDEQRLAAEALVLVGSIDLDVLADVTGEEALDGLDLRGLLAVSQVDGRTIVSLAHPLLTEILGAQLPPLRARRLKAKLVEAMTGNGVIHGSHRLLLTRWRLEGGDEIEPDHLAEAARLAIVQKEFSTARQLTDRLMAEARSPAATQLDAELLYRLGRFDEVEAALAAIDLDELDDDTRAQVVRRRAANLVWDQTTGVSPVALIEANLDRVSGPAALSLEAAWVTFSVLTGRPGEVLARAEAALAKADGAVRRELARGVAICRALVGRSQAALDIVGEEADRTERRQRSFWGSAGGLFAYAELMALVDSGRLAEAPVFDQEALASAPTMGWQPYGEAMIDLHRGRPQTIVERLGPLIDIGISRGYDYSFGLIKATLAHCELLLGRPDRALELAIEADPFIANRTWLEIDQRRFVNRVFAVTGHDERAVDRLIDVVPVAVSMGTIPLVVNLLHDIADLGSVEVAVRSIDELGLDPEGELLRVKLADVRARAAGDRAAIMDAGARFEAMGVRLYAASAYRAAVDLTGFADAHEEITRVTTTGGASFIM